MSRPRPVILDISEHQLPSQMNYAQLAQQIDWVIVRVQYGSWHQDKQFQPHLEAFKRLNVPVNVYAWVRGISEADMRQEAEDFYQRAADYQPSFWWLDIEELTMPSMVEGCEHYRRRLKELGAKKVGAYIGNHCYHAFGFTAAATDNYDGIWMPAYGQNTGNYQGANPTATSHYDLHQYTSNGRLAGYGGPLDLSRIASQKPTAYFTEGAQVSQLKYQLGNRVTVSGLFVSSTASEQLKPLRTEGTITRIIEGARNPYLLDNGVGWVNESVMSPSQSGRRQYQVKPGETLSGIALKLGVNWQEMARLNQLTNPHLIYLGQVLYY